MVEKSNFYPSATSLIYSLQWPTVNDIITSETVAMMYKSLNTLLCKHLSELFIKTQVETSEN